MSEQIVPVDLNEGLRIAVVAQQQGPQLVARGDITARLSSVTQSMETVAREALEAVKKVAPQKATVDISFGLAIEQGTLVALLGQGKAEAAISVSLEWSRSDGD